MARIELRAQCVPHAAIAVEARDRDPAEAVEHSPLTASSFEIRTVVPEPVQPELSDPGPDPPTHLPPRPAKALPPQLHSRQRPLEERDAVSFGQATRGRRSTAFTIRSVEYYYANVRDELGAAYRVLSQLAERGVNLLAFTSVPAGPSLAQFALFPADPAKLVAESRATGLALDGPHHALLVQGDDELGALAGVHERLVDAGVDISRRRA